jgi:hypothetical protein
LKVKHCTNWPASQLYYPKDHQTHQDAVDLSSRLESEAKEWAVDALNDVLEAAEPAANAENGALGTMAGAGPVPAASKGKP